MVATITLSVIAFVATISAVYVWWPRAKSDTESAEQKRKTVLNH